MYAPCIDQVELADCLRCLGLCPRDQEIQMLLRNDLEEYGGGSAVFTFGWFVNIVNAPPSRERGLIVGQIEEFQACR